MPALRFDEPGSKDVETTWTLGGAGSGYEGWQAIEVPDPKVGVEQGHLHPELQLTLGLGEEALAPLRRG